MPSLLASAGHKYTEASYNIDRHTHPSIPLHRSINKQGSANLLASSPMASLSSYFLLAAVALAALFAVGSCGTELTLTIGKDSSSTKLSLITNVAISEVSVKPKGATDFSDDLKESPANTFTLDSKEPIKGPISFRFAAKAGGYRVVDDVIPADFKAGAVYKTGEQV